MKASALHLATLAAFALLLTLPQPASAADPCKLLTVDEIAHVLGNSVAAIPLGTNGCNWKGAPQGASIILRDASIWERTIAPSTILKKESVSGIGDAASFSGSQSQWTLSVKQGNNVLIVKAYNGTADQQRSSEQALAKLALKRL
jgi:hypothetical protein